MLVKSKLALYMTPHIYTYSGCFGLACGMKPVNCKSIVPILLCQPSVSCFSPGCKGRSWQIPEEIPAGLPQLARPTLKYHLLSTCELQDLDILQRIASVKWQILASALQGYVNVQAQRNSYQVYLSLSTGWLAYLKTIISHSFPVSQVSDAFVQVARLDRGRFRRKFWQVCLSLHARKKLLKFQHRIANILERIMFVKLQILASTLQGDMCI